jgi:hypothetical protein
MRKNLPTIEAMRALAFDAGTGTFAKQNLCKSTGYIYVAVSGHSLQAHRVVWAREHGEWPALQIDHINGVRTDNRPQNLRLATGMQNMHNSGVTAKSKSGIKGVHWCKDKRKWGAWICVNKKRIGLGRFDRIEDAAAAYASAATKHFGEFARTA